MMKLLFFDDFRLGVLHGESVVDVSDVVKDILHLEPQQLICGVIERFETYRRPLEEAAERGQGKPVASVRVRPPLPRPSNIVCMAVNYMEDGTRSEPAPINAFQKSPNAIIGPGDTMLLPDIAATIFEGEAEIALVIGKHASGVSAAHAMDYIFGYVNFIDGSARGVPAFLQWVTSIHALDAGDILATGTNHRGLNPFMDGDTVELETEGLGRLRIGVRDALGRTWARETRLQRQEQGFADPTPQLTGRYANSA